MIIKRLLSAIPLLLILSLFCFAIVRQIPGDPVDVLLGNSQKDIPAEELTSLRKEFGLDEPWPKQYFVWLGGFVGKGELGRSYRDGKPVLTVIGERIGPTAALTGTALIFTFVGGIAFGLFMSYLSVLKFQLPCRVAYLATLLVYSTPSFYLALIALFVFTQWTQAAPVLAFNNPGQANTPFTFLSHVWLPALVLAIRRGAKVALFIKSSITEELSKQYVIAALSKGLSYKAVIIKHVFKNSLMPVISLLGLSLPSLLGGSVLVETIFAWPGLGRLTVEATFGRNYPVLVALTVIYGVLVVLANLLADIISQSVDPRLKNSRQSATSKAYAKS
ncbi:MAG: ABC transporter permease [Candidatus Obscuribacterales bacterium]|nr:ABC transporter permease [Candidatus Obscuribacterales bacterium]